MTVQVRRKRVDALEESRTQVAQDGIKYMKRHESIVDLLLQGDVWVYERAEGLLEVN